MKITEVTDKDLYSLLELHYKLQQLLPLKLSCSSSAWILLNEINKATNRDVLVIGLFKENILVGFINGYALNDDIFHFSNIYVEKQYRYYTKKLMEEAESKIKTLIKTEGNAPFNSLRNNSYLSLAGGDYDSDLVGPLIPGYIWLFSCDDSIVDVTVRDGTTSRASETVSSDGDDEIGTSGIIIRRVTNTSYVNDYHYYIKENLVPDVQLKDGLVIDLVQTDGIFNYAIGSIQWSISNM